MENTGEILFRKGAKPEWFLALGDQSVGPLQASDILERIQAQEVTYFHYVWKDGFTEWQRICDVPEFQNAKPKAPGKKPPTAPTVKQAAPKPSKSTPASTEAKEWFLYYNDSQFGPFSKGEVARYLQLGKIHPKVHVWKDGLEAWTVLGEVPALKDLIALAKNKDGKAPAERRKASRKPLVARIIMANDSSIVTAVCRDISVGGMQVLTDKIPGKVGSKIKMNVSPAGKKSGADIAAFVAEGVIVRILEDGRGFSFRFDKMSPESKKSIEGFIKNNE